MSPLKLLKRLDEMSIDTLMWATAAVKLIGSSKALEKYVPQGLKCVFFAGENMPSRLLNIWRRALPDVKYVNLYGPTEITVDCAYYVVERELADDESVPIGAACGNMEIMLLDGDTPVRSGESGEIVVRGIGVGLGYYNDAERSLAAFVQNPLNNAYREIVYRTGDIARVNGFGELVYLSRKDGQVKHMGSRVELGEIESVAAAIEGVELVFCAYDGDSDRIVMFYQGDATDLAAKLSGKLPRYMCPNAIERLDVMPVTPNGKIDRNGIWRSYCDKG
jgi:non-ribosomal peptide synthetase component F